MINKLSIFFSNFRRGTVIRSEEFNQNNKQIQDKVNEVIDVVDRTDAYKSEVNHVHGIDALVIDSEISIEDDSISIMKLNSFDMDEAYYKKMKLKLN